MDLANSTGKLNILAIEMIKRCLEYLWQKGMEKTETQGSSNEISSQWNDNT